MRNRPQTGNNFCAGDLMSWGLGELGSGET
jgi:hypothetical protein